MNKIFAIGDLHLPGPDDKSMDMFGAHWRDHFDKIREDWLARVGADDLVLIPGDISWAMTREQARPDIEAILALPGKKVILRGNHDYWWDSISRVREMLGPDATALQNDCYIFGDTVICGTRGWLCPQRKEFTKQDQKIYDREGVRMRLSLEDARKKAPGLLPRVMMHYPPFNSFEERTVFVELFEEFGVTDVIYGHLHSLTNEQRPFEGTLNGVRYRLVACDYLRFRLLEWV